MKRTVTIDTARKNYTLVNKSVATIHSRELENKIKIEDSFKMCA